MESSKREKVAGGDGKFVNSLARGLEVLQAFSRDGPKMSLTEIAKATGLNTAVVWRCLHTLVRLGYVRKLEKKFMLGPAILSLGKHYFGTTNLKELARPILEEVRDSTGCSTAIAVLSGQDVMFVDFVSTKLM